ncbi:MAG: pyrroline-5-carboxylate reductase family protein [Cloacibacillus evryensis]
MKIGFMGSGAIAEILSQKITASGTAKPSDIFIYDVSVERLAYMNEKYGLSICGEPKDMIAAADYVFMCVRSDNAIDMEDAQCLRFHGQNYRLDIFRHRWRSENNVPGAAWRANHPNPRAGSATASSPSPSTQVSEPQKADLMRYSARWAPASPSERKRSNAITSLTGPAPVYAFFQGIVESALLLGIDHKTAAKMAFGTVEGCLKVWENNIDNIGGLLAETSTPGGISVRQLYNLEQNAFKATVKECYEEGYLRTKAYSDGILEMLNRD